MEHRVSVCSWGTLECRGLKLDRVVPVRRSLRWANIMARTRLVFEWEYKSSARLQARVCMLPSCSYTGAQTGGAGVWGARKTFSTWISGVVAAKKMKDPRKWRGSFYAAFWIRENQFSHIESLINFNRVRRGQVRPACWKSRIGRFDSVRGQNFLLSRRFRLEKCGVVSLKLVSHIGVSWWIGGPGAFWTE